MFFFLLNSKNLHTDVAKNFKPFFFFTTQRSFLKLLNTAGRNKVYEENLRQVTGILSVSTFDSIKCNYEHSSSGVGIRDRQIALRPPGW